MAKKPIKEATKEMLIADFQKVYDKYKKKGNLGIPNRDYYDHNGQYSSRTYNSLFTSFALFKTEFLNFIGETDSSIDYKKKIYSIETELRNLKIENKDLLKKSISEDNILSLYEERLNLGLLVDIKNVKVKPLSKSKKNKEAILVISDTHLGEIISSLEINGINEYNSSIMVERLDRIFYYFVYYCKQQNIDVINLFLLGDLLSGCHHEELLRTNEMDDVSSTFFLQEYFCNKVLEIEKDFKEVKIEVLVGNHSRIPEGKPQFKGAAKLNYEYILAKQMKMFFDLTQKNNKNPKIKLNISDSLFKVVTVADRSFLITHGHMLSNGSNSFAGIPYYGLAMSASKLDGAFKQFQDLHFSDIIMGHLHALSKVKTPIGNLYINGSVIGTGEFSLFKMKLAGIPEQLMLIVEDGFVNSEITLRA